MKKFMIIVFVFQALSIGLSAQSRFTEQEKQEVITRYRMFLTELGLTEEQKPVVEQINLTYFEGLSGIRNSNASRLKKYRTFKKLRATKDREMQTILTPEQYRIYKEKQDELEDDFKERRRNGT